MVLHGVSMSLGSADGLRPDYLARLCDLVQEIEPMFVSDHLSWSRIGHFNSHDLLPLPYTQEALNIICNNIDQAQEALGGTMLVENPSSYLAYAESTMTEWSLLPPWPSEPAAACCST